MYPEAILKFICRSFEEQYEKEENEQTGTNKKSKPLIFFFVKKTTTTEEEVNAKKNWRKIDQRLDFKIVETTVANEWHFSLQI